jgi:CubicO group peptidase (beta-lactamase class C family)
MKRLFAFVFFCFNFFSSAFSQHHCFRFADGSNEFKNELEKMANAKGPGFALQVLHKDSVIFSYTTGLADISNKTSITHETPFYIASIGKTFTAAAVLLLLQDKKLLLQDFIGQYIPGLPASTQQIRIYQLLNHTSGLVDYYDVLGEDLHDFYNRDVLDFVRKTDSLSFSPGVSYAYSNTAYVLLSLIVEKISGQSFATFLKDRIFTPLQMNHTTVIDKPYVAINNKAIGYRMDSAGTVSVSDYESVYTTGGGGIYSTTNDLVKWVNSLQSGKLLNKRLADLMFDFPVTLAGTKSYFGMGWTNESYGPKTPELNGLKSFGSFGVLKGFRSAIILFPDADLSMVLLGNSTQTDLLAQKLIKHFIKTQ